MIRLVTRLLGRVWLWVTTWSRGAPKRLRTIHLEELPEQLDAGVVYVLGEGPHRWFVALLCPCGCGATVQVSLLADAKPRWHLLEHPDKTISLHPSVWRKVGCRSHFFLRNGCIQWCGNDSQA